MKNETFKVQKLIQKFFKSKQELNNNLMEGI